MKSKDPDIFGHMCSTNVHYLYTFYKGQDKSQTNSHHVIIQSGYSLEISMTMEKYNVIENINIFYAPFWPLAAKTKKKKQKKKNRKIRRTLLKKKNR